MRLEITQFFKKWIRFFFCIFKKLLTEKIKQVWHKQIFVCQVQLSPLHEIINRTVQWDCSVYYLNFLELLYWYMTFYLNCKPFLFNYFTYLFHLNSDNSAWWRSPHSLAKNIFLTAQTGLRQIWQSWLHLAVGCLVSLDPPWLCQFDHWDTVIAYSAFGDLVAFNLIPPYQPYHHG